MELEVCEDSGNETASKGIIEFLEVAIHNVIYTRHLYTSSSFTSKQRYGTPIRMCTHPGVSGYIQNCLEGIQELLKISKVQSIHLKLVQKDSEPLESFVFDFSNANPSIYLQDLLLKESIQQFQMFCLKLGISHSHLRMYPPSTSFQIQVVTTTDAWENVLLKSGDTKFLWCSIKSSTEKLNSVDAVIRPEESFRTAFLSARNIQYKISTPSQV